MGIDREHVVASDTVDQALPESVQPLRKKIVDGHKDYQQILSYPQPPVEKFAKTPADIDEFCKIINDGFAELIAKEKDHFPGWVAQVSLAASDAGVAEAERALKNGALGVQIYTNVAGKPIDRPEYLPFWKKMNELGAPIRKALTVPT